MKEEFYKCIDQLLKVKEKRWSVNPRTKKKMSSKSKKKVGIK
jgi:hypothetical protein